MLGSYFSSFQLTEESKQYSEACVHVKGTMQSSAETEHFLMDLEWADTAHGLYTKTSYSHKTCTWL